MHHSWHTAQEDLALAEFIIEKHANLLSDEEQLAMPQINLRTDSTPEYIVPEWILEIAEVFDDRYGLKHGDYVTRCVLTHYLTKNSSVH